MCFVGTVSKSLAHGYSVDSLDGYSPELKWPALYPSKDDLARKHSRSVSWQYVPLDAGNFPFLFLEEVLGNVGPLRYPFGQSAAFQNNQLFVF